jgi:hypothetical protein
MSSFKDISASLSESPSSEAQITLLNSSNSLGSVTFLSFSVPPSVFPYSASFTASFSVSFSASFRVFSAPPPPSQPPPISLDDPEVSQAMGRILRLRVPMAIRDRIWIITDPTNASCTLKRSKKKATRSKISKKTPKAQWVHVLDAA